MQTPSNIITFPGVIEGDGVSTPTYPPLRRVGLGLYEASHERTGSLVSVVYTGGKRRGWLALVGDELVADGVDAVECRDMAFTRLDNEADAIEAQAREYAHAA